MVFKTTSSLPPTPPPSPPNPLPMNIPASLYEYHVILKVMLHIKLSRKTIASNQDNFLVSWAVWSMYSTHCQHMYPVSSNSLNEGADIFFYTVMSHWRYCFKETNHTYKIYIHICTSLEDTNQITIYSR